MKVIGIDIGTTTVSAVVLEPDGHGGQKLLTSRTIANGSFLKGADRERIQDAEKLTDKAKAVLDELLAAYPETEAIGLTRADAWYRVYRPGRTGCESFVYMGGWKRRSAGV